MISPEELSLANDISYCGSSTAGGSAPLLLCLGAGAAWPLSLHSSHFSGKLLMQIMRFLAEHWSTFYNLMFLLICCGLYLILYLTKRPVLAEPTGSRVVWEHVCLRSEGQSLPSRLLPSNERRWFPGAKGLQVGVFLAMVAPGPTQPGRAAAAGWADGDSLNTTFSRVTHSPLRMP